MRRASETAVQGALDRLNTPYRNYEGQRIADLHENELLGMTAARRNYGAFDADFDRARDYVGSIQSVADPGALEGYMNPYLDEVLRPQVRRRNEAFEAARAEMDRRAGMVGAFGGRHDLRRAALEDHHQMALDDLYGQAYAGAFDRATALFSADQDRKLAQASAFTDIASRQQAANQAALRDLMATGMVGRTRDQAELDFRYLEHLESRDWDINNIGTLVEILQRVPHEYSTTGEQTTTITKSDSPLKTIAGIGAIAAGAIMTGGASLGKVLLDVGVGSLGGTGAFGGDE